MMYTRKPLGTTIHAVALIASATALAYGLYITHKEVVYLLSKEPSDSGPITELAILSLILVILVKIFFIIVSFLYLFTPNIIIPMYKSEDRLILLMIHTILSVGMSVVAIWLIVSFGELDHEAVLLTIDSVLVVVASVSMWLGVGNPLFQWNTSTKSEELIERTV